MAAAFGAISIGAWSLAFSGFIAFTPYGGSYFWHLHEMLFGFTVAVIVGFLLTAVQTWTKVSSIKGTPLLLLVLLWLSARIMMAFPILFSNNSASLSIIASIDVLFLPISAIFLAIPILKARLWRNLFFVPILLIMAILNVLMHASLLGSVSTSFIDSSHTMIMLITLVMCVMGGRVFPMFTASGTQTERSVAVPWLEKLAIVSVVLCLIAQSKILPLPNSIAAAIFLIAGAVNLVRASRWKIWVTFYTPLVWSLHLSYWAICLGLIFLAMAKLQWLFNTSIAYHTLTVGGMGVMILSMITRVSLGHTPLCQASCRL